MSLRPADLSGAIVQSNNVERVSQNVAQQSRAHQEVITQQMLVQTDAAQSQVQGTPPAEGNTIRDDGEGGGGGGGGFGRRRRRASPELPQEEDRSVSRPRGRKSARIDFRA